ncbi:MAG: hypothetical protein WBA93_00690, partial [Microcoleaceae cyanobacterium]
TKKLQDHKYIWRQRSKCLESSINHFERHQKMVIFTDGISGFSSPPQIVGGSENVIDSPS